MKRDWDVIREVLEEIEALSAEEQARFLYAPPSNPDPDNPDPDNLDLAKQWAKFEHARLLRGAGFIDALPEGPLSGSAILSPRLTWQGHDLLSTLRSKPVWERITKTAKDKGLELTVDVVTKLGKLALDAIIRG